MAQGRVEDGIAESTLYLLRTGGPRAVTVEAVAAHSGIAKTTIYRRHPNRRDMLAGALSRLASPGPLDPRASARIGSGGSSPTRSQRSRAASDSVDSRPCSPRMTPNSPRCSGGS